MGPKVFLSYRRADTGDIAPSVADRLRSDLGRSAVFRDAEDLIAGQQWEPALEAALADSDAAVFLVGPDWVGKRDDESRRIDDADDPVRHEVRQALNATDGAQPVPVFVDRHSPPVQLPPDVADLFARHAVTSTRESLLSHTSKDYQGVLVGIWESIRQRTPGGVLIIGDDTADAKVDELIDGLRAKHQIDARRLSQVAAGVYVVSARRLRRAAKKWPDVIVVLSEGEPSETTQGRLEALRSMPSIRRMTVAGVGAAGVVAGFLASQVAAGSASVTAAASTAEVAAVLPGASGTVATIGSAWTNAAAGVKGAVAAVAAVAVIGVGVTTVLDPGSSLIDLGVVGEVPVVGAGSVTPAAVDGFVFTPTTDAVFVDATEVTGGDCLTWAVSVQDGDLVDSIFGCGASDLGEVEVVPGGDYVLTVTTTAGNRVDYAFQIWPVPPQETMTVGVVGEVPVVGAGSVTPAAVDGFVFTPTTDAVFVDATEVTGGDCLTWAVSVQDGDLVDSIFGCGASDLGEVEVVPGGDYVLTVTTTAGNRVDYAFQIWPVPPQETMTVGVVGEVPVVGAGSVTPAAVDGFVFTPTTDAVFVDATEVTGGDCLTWAVSVQDGDLVDSIFGCGASDLGEVEVVPGGDYVLTVTTTAGNRVDYAFQIWPVPPQETMTVGVVGEVPVVGAGSVTPAAVDGFVFTPTTDAVFVDATEVTGGDCLTWAVSVQDGDLVDSIFGCGASDLGEVEVVPGGDYVLTVTTTAGNRVDYAFQIWPVPPQETMTVGVVGEVPVVGAGSVTPAAVDGFVFTPTTDAVFVDATEVTGGDCLTWAVSVQDGDLVDSIFGCGASDLGEVEVVPGGDYVLTVTTTAGNRVDYAFQICRGSACP